MVARRVAGKAGGVVLMERLLLPPVNAPSHATPLLCTCGNVLGVVEGKWLWLRHKGRMLVAQLPARMRCERCGHNCTLRPA